MIWVDEQSELERISAILQKAPKIAVDTEADSLHSYFDKVCLVQFSTASEEILVDPLAKIDLRALRELFANRDVTKVFHAADYDLRILHRDFDITVANIVDTMICAQLLGITSFGLAALLDRYFGVKLDKTHQLSDWSKRPLTPDMLKYAATDTHYLIALSEKLQGELETLGRWEWALEEFARLESIRFREKDADEGEEFRRMKGLAKLDRRTLGVVARLYDWRDQLARKLDRPPFKVLGNETIITIAERRPETSEELRQIRGMSPFVMQRNGAEILREVRAVLAMEEDQLPQPVSAKPWIRDREMERRVERMKRVRDRVASELKVDASVLAPRHVLAAIAASDATTLDDLAAVPAMRQWQRNLIGKELLEAMSS